MEQTIQPKPKQLDFRLEIKTLKERHKISTAALARHPKVNLNAMTIYPYLRGEADMLGKNIQNILNYLRSL